MNLTENKWDSYKAVGLFGGKHRQQQTSKN